MAALQGAMARVGEPMLPLPDVGPLPAPPEGAADGVPPLEAFGVAGGEEALEGGGFVARYEGGEDEGLARLDAFLARGGGKEAAVFEKPNTSPAAWRDGEQETTVLSPHLALGTVGVRAVYHAVRAVQREHSAGGGAVSQPPVSLIGQLMFRELFHACAATVPGFEGMAGNAMCRQVAWGAGEEDAERWRRWERAETGFPWIDALMTQLRTEGFVHHLGRHSLACFLTRGDLWVSWERGAETFEKYLVDWDEALNAGNWMWLSASAFFHQFHRVYSPVAFAKRWSLAPAFIRHYLPVLARVPDAYIFEPWTMPPSVARVAGVEVGRDYPRPMVDHKVASKENIARMAEAFRENKKEKDGGDSGGGGGGRGRGGTKRKGGAGRGGGAKTYKMSK